MVTLRWARLSDPLLRDRTGAQRGVTATEFQGAVTRAFNTWNAVETATTSSQFAGFTQARPALRRRHDRDRLQNRPDLERTLAATNFLIDVTDRRDRRVGHLLQHDVSVVHRVGRGDRPLRRRVDRAPRDRPSARPRSLGARRDRDPAGRPARARRRSGDVPDRVHRRQHRRSPSAARRHRRHHRHLSAQQRRLAAPRQHHRQGHQERRRRLGAHVVAFNPRRARWSAVSR